MRPRTPGEIAILRRTVAIRFVSAAVLLSLMFFLPAGTPDYWQAWTYIAVLFGSAALLIIYFMKHDPELLERRMRTREREATQRRVVSIGTPLFLLSFLVPGFDRRYGWSAVPDWLAIASDVVILVGYLLFVRVLMENRYASRVVEVEQGQRVVTTGPYAVVRHPMYVAAILIFLFSPLALGSFWGLLATLIYPLVIVVRIRNEEELLMKNLEGYREYMSTVRYRLIPGVW
jgi:protein-S-isoprenylcysteine O-methyltransferase Ste14